MISNPDGESLSDTQPDAGNQDREQTENRELEGSIEKLTAEYNRRISIFLQSLEELDIPKENIIIRPPITNRTDFGYVSSIDFILIGSQEKSEKLSNSLAEKGIYDYKINFDEKDLDKIKNFYPKMYDFIMSHRGKNLPVGISVSALPEEITTEDESQIEGFIRHSLTNDEKESVRESRTKIAGGFIDEINEIVPVLSYKITGSMVEDFSRFGPNSDIDMDILIDPDETEERLLLEYISTYLIWKYAETYNVKIDVIPDVFAHIKEMSKYPDFKTLYEKMYDIFL